ncbi:hypothetical protein [Bradyrhizobium sp. BRP56]|uniref:hypothetical protein n=1 Tax=Bradyrhizobium sp. BRP56 TaxID=2793819 RepID=UPI001CD63BD4|nr:hypothetical protein [Bradyrhizobium sp. BRP56]MCA1399358.1 hypothetical protein [Bradyrhizobium sp. BRP56]
MSASAIAGVLLLIIIACILFLAVERRDKQLKQDAPSYSAPPRIAVVEVQSKLTGGGQFCVVMLALTILVSASLYHEATTVFLQIHAGIAMIAGTLLFGLGIALCRKTTYTVFDAKPVAMPPPMPPEQPLHSWSRN